MFRYFPVLLLVACAGGPNRENDVRIDGAPGWVDPIAHGARTCTADGTHIQAAWVDDREGRDAVHFNTSTDGGLTWGFVAQRVNNSTELASAPDIACDGPDVHIVWEDRGDGNLEHPNTYVVTSNDNGASFGEPTLLERDVDGKYVSLAPQVVAEGGYVHIVWQNNLYGAFDVFAVSSADRGFSYTDAARLNTNERGSSWSGEPAIAADASGRVAVAWEDMRSGASDIFVTTSSDGGQTWSGEARVDSGDDPGLTASHGVSVAISASGAVTAAWHDKRLGEAWSIYANQSADGVSWLDSAVHVDPGDGFSDSMSPVVAMTGGTAHIAWHDEQSGAFRVLYRQLAGGMPTTEAIELSNPSTSAAHALYPQIATEGDTVVVVWEDTRNDLAAIHNDLYYDYSDDGGLTWMPFDGRINSGRAAKSPAVDPSIGVIDGELIAAWTDGRNDNDDSYFNRLPLGASEDPLPEPSEASDDLDEGVSE